MKYHSGTETYPYLGTTIKQTNMLITTNLIFIFPRTLISNLNLCTEIGLRIMAADVLSRYNSLIKVPLGLLNCNVNELKHFSVLDAR